MKLTKVHLFVLLLLALVLCSFFGGACGSGLEGFNMPSDSSHYKGKGQYSDQYSNYSDLYSANKQFSKGQDAVYDRKDKPAAPDNNPNYKPSNPGESDDDVSKYAPYDNGNNSNNSNNSSSGNSRKGQGIPGSQIPPGQDDLYILKSEIVPPVCPACPSMKCNGSNSGGGGGGGNNKCPPCPPCARCPEPAFECKKVPNYNSSNDNVLPRPVLNSFSQFGL
jgi:hypothetical protein